MVPIVWSATLPRSFGYWLLHWIFQVGRRRQISGAAVRLPCTYMAWLFDAFIDLSFCTVVMHRGAYYLTDTALLKRNQAADPRDVETLMRCSRSRALIVANRSWAA
jgi:hypothetical protein